jgi:hypothetical protein
MDIKENYQNEMLDLIKQNTDSQEQEAVEEVENESVETENIEEKEETPIEERQRSPAAKARPGRSLRTARRPPSCCPAGRPAVAGWS